jgi:glycosyltransferase involved in cell wall biosynthesis
MKNLQKKIKVCHIVRYAKIAGTETHVYLLATHLDRAVVDSHVLLLEEGDLVSNLEGAGVEVTVIPNSKSGFHYLRLILFFIRGKFDIVHCHSGGYACLAAKLAGVKRIVYTKHGIGATKEELIRRSFGRKLRDILINMCVIQYIALTEYDKYVMTRVLHIDRNNIEIIHNGIDTGIKVLGKRKRKKNPVVGFVGRLEKQKGISYLIEAIPQILQRYNDLEVLIAGSGSEEVSLKALARALRVRKSIEFLGFVRDPLDIINQLDIFVLPSVWEGFPYVLLEAMLLRKPIVATNIFGINEIIKHEKSGVLVRARDPKSIAVAVLDLLAHRAKARRLGSAAYARLLRRYTADGTASQIKELYFSLIQTRE